MSAGAEQDTETVNFPMTPGATYLVEMQVALSANFAGRLTVAWVIPGIQYHLMGAPNLGNWSTGESIPYNFDSNSAKVLASFSAIYTVPVNGETMVGRIRLRNLISAGAAEIGSVSITRVVDQTLIGPGSVFTKHLDLATGGHIDLGTTDYDAGNGIWIEGPGSGHGARMFLGNSSAAKLLVDPNNNVLGLYNANIVNPQLSAKNHCRAIQHRRH